MPSQEYNLVHVLRILNKWKKHILIITVAAAIFTAAFSWFCMEDYFLSSTTIYPINMAYTDRSIMFNTEGAVDLKYFGEKEDVGRVLSIANSTDVKQYIINKYELAKVYDVDTTEKYWRTKVTKEFEGNYKAIKSEQGAIELSVLDTDPLRAKQIIDDIIVKVDDVNRESINASKKQQYDLFGEQIVKQRAEVAQYADTLGKLARQYGIVVRSTEGAEMVDGKDPQAVEQFKIINGVQKEAIVRLNMSLQIYEQIKASLDANTNSLSVLEKSYVSDRKEKPKRSIIVLLAALFAFTAGIFGVLALEEIKELRKQI